MHHHNHNPVYFTLIPSHDCDDINLQMFCWYSCSCSLHKVRCSVVRLKSEPRYTFCQHHMYRLRPYSISSSICPNLCCCIMHPNSICCCVSSLLSITPRVSLLCKCTNWSFEADMAASAQILCHYKFIYTPIIKVPSLFHGWRCAGSPAVAIHAYPYYLTAEISLLLCLSMRIWKKSLRGKMSVNG